MSKPGGQAGGPQGGAGQQGGNMRALSDKLIEDLRQGKIRYSLSSTNKQIKDIYGCGCAQT